MRLAVSSYCVRSKSRLSPVRPAGGRDGGRANEVRELGSVSALGLQYGPMMSGGRGIGKVSPAL